MADLRISDLTAHTTGILAAADLVEVSEYSGGTYTSRKMTGAQLRGAKTYKALISQTSTSAPTATVLLNTLSGTPTFAYAGVGDYTLTLTGEFITAKTTVFMQTGIKDGYARAYRFSDNIIQIETLDNSLTASNDRLIQTSIIIEVYP